MCDTPPDTGHHRGNAGRLESAGRAFVPDALLKPDERGSDLKDRGEQVGHELRPAEDVDQIDGTRCSGRRHEVGVDRLTEDAAPRRMYRDDREAGPLEVLGHTVAGTLGPWAQPHHGNT